MSDSDGGVIRGRGRRRFVRVVEGIGVPATLGYASYEVAQGVIGITGAPVECYKFVQGSNTYRWTSADVSVTLTDGTFTPTTIQRDALDFSQEDTAQNLSIHVPKDNAIATLGRAYNPPTAVTVTIYRKHRDDPEEIILFVGKVMSWQLKGPEAELICAPISEVFRRRVPSIVYQGPCNWTLYGVGCGIAKASFKTSGFVSAVAGTTIRASAFSSHPDGWFTNGWAELASGERRFIVAHVGDQITVQPAFTGLAAGTAIDAYAGCDRTEATCAAKFNNLVNHLGFPRIPTRNPFDGSLV